MMAVVCVHMVIAVFIGVVFHAAFNAFRTQSAESGWFWFKIQWTNVAQMGNIIVDQCGILSDPISKFKVHASIVDPSMGRVEGESAWCMPLHDGVLSMKAIPHTHQLSGSEVVRNGSSFKHKILIHVMCWPRGEVKGVQTRSLQNSNFFKLQNYIIELPKICLRPPPPPPRKLK